MSFAQLERQFRRIAHLEHVSAILSWDEAVMMPEAAGPDRADAMAALGVVLHEHLTAPQLNDWLAVAEQEAGAGKLEAPQRANLREMRRIVRRASALPAQLVEAISRAQLRCEQAWRRQRAANDWQGFAPLLGEVVKLKREAAAALGSALSLAPYDALLDEYEPFRSSADIDRWFADLKSFLPGLIDRVLEHQSRQSFERPRGPFPRAAQEALGRQLMEAVGFDMRRGRLDVSHHPFCGGTPSDVRVTTRYETDDFTSGLMGVLHETGHAKYEQGRPREWIDQPVGQARGMSVHESQSLLQEMQICRGREFLRFATEHIVRAFPEAVTAQPAAYSVDNLFRLFTRVERSKIRVGADEVTYPCHVLIRYDIERALIAGKLSVADIPEAWDAGMSELLGIRTGDDYRDGCMQDVHWSAGAIGYFPTYTLGAMTAAQIFAAAVRAEPAIPEAIARGDFAPINEFLRVKIWSRASLLTTDELLREATGEPLNPAHFERHLERRYLELD
ncbi:MAG TPA: carboxypeptidase M32 [Polyangiales bacterium]|nr:carboxypeptidase M32 [Polyangiales bacterium]